VPRFETLFSKHQSNIKTIPQTVKQHQNVPGLKHFSANIKATTDKSPDNQQSASKIA
jgi:hypothetical protein